VVEDLCSSSSSNVQSTSSSKSSESESDSDCWLEDIAVKVNKGGNKTMKKFIDKIKVGYRAYYSGGSKSSKYRELKEKREFKEATLTDIEEKKQKTLNAFYSTLVHTPNIEPLNARDDVSGSSDDEQEGML
jgi:hypothetical protein